MRRPKITRTFLYAGSYTNPCQSSGSISAGLANKSKFDDKRNVLGFGTQHSADYNIAVILSRMTQILIHPCHWFIRANRDKFSISVNNYHPEQGDSCHVKIDVTFPGYRPIRP